MIPTRTPYPRSARLAFAFVSFALLGAVAASAATCEGQPILEQPPLASSLLYSDVHAPGGAQVLADNFFLLVPALVRELVVWGGYDQNTFPTLSNFRIEVRDNVGGVPGGVTHFRGNVDYVDFFVSGQVAGRDRVQVILTLDEPLSLDAGSYFVSVFHDALESGNSFTWEGSAVGGLHALAQEAPGATWTQASGEQALEICVVPPRTASHFIPYFRAESDGSPTTLFSVRNPLGADLLVDVEYYGVDHAGVPLRVDTVTIPASASRSFNVAQNLAGLDPDADGTAEGSIFVRPRSGFEPDLFGDYYLVDFGNDFATGSRMSTFEDLCRAQDVRFQDFGSGTEITVFLDQVDATPFGLDFTVIAYAQDGSVLSTVEINEAQNVGRYPLADLIAGAESFGSLEFLFASGRGKVTGHYSAFGRFSAQVEGKCKPSIF